jgi:hypothetical protein
MLSFSRRILLVRKDKTTPGRFARFVNGDTIKSRTLDARRACEGVDPKSSRVYTA